MQWVIDALSRHQTITTHKKTNSSFEERRLKYCPECNLVWEINYTGATTRHTDMPTLGLKRIVCRLCESK